MSEVQKINLDDVEGKDTVASERSILQARMRKKKKKRKTEQSEEAKKKMPFVRGAKNSIKGVTSNALRQTLKKSEQIADKSVETSSKAQILLPQEAGLLEADGEMERTWRMSQNEIKDYVDERSQKRMFDLQLDQFGPYMMDFTRNGRHVLLGGRKGHIAIMNWGKMELTTELHVRETIRDVTFLHDETMIAVAQKKYLYIYDNTGTELHCLKHHFDINAMGFLPYHYLLASVGETGYLKYIDTSTGQNVAEHRTKLGPCKVLRQNPANAVTCLGHSNGSVTMWAPNMTTPLVRMLCHRAPILDIAIDRGGYNLVTSGVDGQLKVWDIRTYKELHSYFTPTPAHTIDLSDMGLLSVACGSQVRVWKDALRSKQQSPYMVQRLPAGIRRLRFVPFEDQLAATTDKGISSLLIPGAGEPNFDTFEANPFETKKQRRERTVVTLLEKLQPDMITLDPNIFGLMDSQSKVALDSDRRAVREEKEKEQLVDQNKQRGRSRSSKRWKRRRKNIVDFEFEQRKDKIKKLHTLRQKDKKDAARAKQGKAKDTLDRFA